MKKLIFILLGIIFMALPSEAQLLRSRTFSKAEGTGFNRITIGYDALFLDQHIGTANGVNLQYIHGFNIAKSPLFLEVGLGVSYNSLSYQSQYGWVGYDETTEKYVPDYRTEDETAHSLSVRIPVNLSYMFSIGEKISLQPYTGISLKINPLFSDYYVRQYEFTSLTASTGIEYESDEDLTNKLLQFGWQIGVGLNISKLYLGVQYGLDFMQRAKLDCRNYVWKYDGYYNDDYSSGGSGSKSIKSSQFLFNIGLNF